MSGLFAIAKPYRIKAAHRRRRKCALGRFVQRYYDPGIGRFLSVDPVTADGNTGSNFNRYKYAANNPYRFIDPDGRLENEEYKKANDEDTQKKNPMQSGSMTDKHLGLNSSIKTDGGITGGGVLDKNGASNIAGGTASSVQGVTLGVSKLVPTEIPEGLDAFTKLTRVARYASGINTALSLNEAVTGDTVADRWHGRLNLGLAAITLPVPEAIPFVRAFGFIDSAVQLHENYDRQTHEITSGWTAIYRDITR